MGLYDTVYLECPQCGHENDFQSKSGPCQCLNFDQNDIDQGNVPVDVFHDINRHSPIVCHHCETPYEAKIQYTVIVEAVRSKTSDPD